MTDAPDTTKAPEGVALLADLQQCFDQRISCACATPMGDAAYVELATVPGDLLKHAIAALSPISVLGEAPVLGEACRGEHQPGCDCVFQEQKDAPHPPFLTRMAGVDHENREALREKVARLIDPMIYRVVALGNGLSDEGAARIDAAVAKADAILAALQSKPEGQT